MMVDFGPHLGAQSSSDIKKLATLIGYTSDVVCESKKALKEEVMIAFPNGTGKLFVKDVALAHEAISGGVTHESASVA